MASFDALTGRSCVVADCDALNVVLVHLGLGDALAGLLRRCGRTLVTLDAVYRREAQQAVRALLDHLERSGLLFRAASPDDEELSRPAQKLFQKIQRAAESHPTTSQNDRRLLFLAEVLGVDLVTEDGPLRRLARDRGCPAHDVLDVLDAMTAVGVLPSELREGYLARNGSRAQPRQTAEDQARESTHRGGLERFACLDARGPAPAG